MSTSPTHTVVDQFDETNSPTSRKAPAALPAALQQVAPIPEHFGVCASAPKGLKGK